jgi:hypothetical protein
MEREGSLPCSQEPSSSPCPEPERLDKHSKLKNFIDNFIYVLMEYTLSGLLNFIEMWSVTWLTGDR